MNSVGGVFVDYKRFQAMKKCALEKGDQLLHQMEMSLYVGERNLEAGDLERARRDLIRYDNLVQDAENLPVDNTCFRERANKFRSRLANEKT